MQTQTPPKCATSRRTATRRLLRPRRQIGWRGQRGRPRKASRGDKGSACRSPPQNDLPRGSRASRTFLATIAIRRDSPRPRKIASRSARAAGPPAGIGFTRLRSIDYPCTLSHSHRHVPVDFCRCSVNWATTNDCLQTDSVIANPPAQGRPTSPPSDGTMGCTVCFMGPTSGTWTHGSAVR